MQKYFADNLGCIKMINFGKEILYKVLVLIVGANQLSLGFEPAYMGWEEIE